MENIVLQIQNFLINIRSVKENCIYYRDISLLLLKTKRGLDYSADTALT